MADFKKSEFTEISDHHVDMTHATNQQPPTTATGTTPAITDIQEFDEINDVPETERFSWNPLDWYIGIRREIQEFNFTIDEKKRVLIRAMFGEGLVTFLFLFIVMATAVNNGRQETPENLVLGAVSTALASVALIYSFADVSGAHFNPAVTFATVITGKVSVRKGIAFIGIQLLASIFSTLFLMAVFPGVNGAGVGAIPAYVVVQIDSSAHIVQAFFMEFILTFILVYVVFATAFDTVDTKGVKVAAKGVSATTPGTATTADDEAAERESKRNESAGQNLTIYTTSGNTKAGFAPIAIGFTLGFLGLIGGTVSGGAFNPARAFGPALVSGQGWRDQWIYWIADFAGAGVAGWAQHFFAHEAVQHSASIRTKQAADIAKSGGGGKPVAVQSTRL